jgi:hypothetical protein
MLLLCCMRLGTGVYVADDIVLASRPMTPTNNCFGTRGAEDRAARFDDLLGKKGSRHSAAPKPADSNARGSDKDGAKVASTEPASKARDPNLYSGIALIYFGPMAVNSRVHDVKVDQGMLRSSAILPVHRDTLLHSVLCNAA